MTRNIKLLLEFDGTDYEGWQIQPLGHTTIQSTIIKAVEEALGETDIEVKGACRTDSGVHAQGYVASFKTTSNIPAENFAIVINAELPDDIVVVKSSDAPPDFNPKKDSIAKRYEYRILVSPFNSPIFKRHAWVLDYDLDIDLMNQGASLLIGKKDFSSFMAAHSDAKSTVREILDFTVKKDKCGFIILEVYGNAFLRHMIRIMVGTLVELGRGKITLGDIDSIITSRDRTAACMTAPSQGLFLVEIDY